MRMQNHRRMMIEDSMKEPETRLYKNRYRPENSANHIRDYHTPIEEGGTYSNTDFHDMYRMHRGLYNRILAELVAINPGVFGQLYDCRGVSGHSPKMKMTSAFRILGHGCAAHTVDEKTRTSKTSTLLYFKEFCRTIVAHFGERYLRKLTPDDIERLLAENAARGFPGMLGCVDCMHMWWKNCPISLQGQFIGHVRKPTISIEAIASYDLWLWHAFSGEPGSSNDVNVMEKSHIHDELLNGTAPPVNFTILDRNFRMGYYLADGIYPAFSNLVKMFRVPNTPQRVKFNKQHTAKRKDVERPFGVLQGKFAILTKPCHYRDPKLLDDIVYTCIILHNMIIENERRDPNWTAAYSGPYYPPHIERNPQVMQENRQRMWETIRNKEGHLVLREYLVAHIWGLHGGGAFDADEKDQNIVVQDEPDDEEDVI